MPMAMYSFLEEYDFSGKTIIPFVASAGSGFSGTISTIREMQPNATVVEEGLHIPMGDVAGAENKLKSGFTDWKSDLRVRRIQRDETMDKLADSRGDAVIVGSLQFRIT